VVKALLAEATVLPDISKPGSGNTALFLAASNGHAKTVAAFVGCDRVNPNTPNAQSFTPLWVAAERGHADVVRELINWQRVQVNKPNRHLATPLFVAAQKNSVGVIRAVSLHSFCPIWPVIVALHVCGALL
jgi:ankyrin repeat protein